MSSGAIKWKHFPLGWMPLPSGPAWAPHFSVNLHCWPLISVIRRINLIKSQITWVLSEGRVISCPLFLALAVPDLSQPLGSPRDLCPVSGVNLSVLAWESSSGGLGSALTSHACCFQRYFSNAYPGPVSTSRGEWNGHRPAKWSLWPGGSFTMRVVTGAVRKVWG